jgi:stage II sporulation protein AA (anti-sigma F factor antagonist)
MLPVRLDILREDTSTNDATVIKLDGKLSLETVNNFLQTVRPERAPELVVDMSGVKFLDSAGVGALVQLFVHRRGQGQGFALAALTQQGKAVMEVSGLLKLLPAYPSVKEAISQKV